MLYMVAGKDLHNYFTLIMRILKAPLHSEQNSGLRKCVLYVCNQIPHCFDKIIDFTARQHEEKIEK